MSTNTETPKNLILFGDKRPDAIGLSQMYDPDIHGVDPLTSGKIVPSVNSLVTDEATDIIYRVSAQNPVTYKSTLRPVKYLITTDGDDNATPSIIDYGNSRFMLYYDDRTKPTELGIDAKLYFFNLYSVEYRLIRKLVDNTQEVISVYLDSDGIFKSDRIPLATVSGLKVLTKYCTNCHTLKQLTDGETITLQLFDTNGILTMEVPLIVKRPDALNDLASDSIPIMKFDADCTQMLGDEFFLYENQSPTVLNIRPYAQLSDGSEKTYPVDNKTCFIYGLERDSIPSYPGRKFKILVKKFLTSRDMAMVSTYDPSLRSVSVEKWINIVKNQTEYSMKVSIIPWYDHASKVYKFKFFAYTEQRDHVYDITNYMTLNEEFDPTLYNIEQYVRLIFDSDTIFKKGVETIYQQSWWLTLREPAMYDKYIIKDSKNDEYAYGVDASDRRRPIIHYSKNRGQYFIPSSVFANRLAFLESFYKVARPPFDTTVELEPVTPTHFTIRALDTGNVLITAPIPVAEYTQAWNSVRVGDASQLVGGTVIVEFLTQIGEEYNIIYGVPVEVVNSTTEFNDPSNP